MTKKEFKQVLERKGYSYKIEGDKIVVTYEMGVDLSLLTSLPPGVVFNNEGYVDLESLTSLPPGVEFNNLDDVYLESLLGGISYDYWKGNIEGIYPNRLLNVMISLGLFER